MDSRLLTHVLSQIAEVASETLDLQEVIHRVAMPLRDLVPFDNLGVVRIVDGERAVIHATTVELTECSGCTEPAPLASWSPRLRPRPGPIPRIDDACLELDRSFPGDADILDGGVRSGMWEPFRVSGPFTGGVFLSAKRPLAFAEEHQEILRPVAALLGSAVEHWRIWDAERRRRERLDRLEALRETLAGSLDARAVFPRIAAAMKPILPHDLMVLTELDIRTRTLRVVAAAGECNLTELPDAVVLTPDEIERRADAVELVHDVPNDFGLSTERERLIASAGMRSWLRVPVRLSDEVRGSIGFFHREPARFGTDDIEVAERVADRVALMISHHQLAEEARVAAEARERAERLAAKVDALTQELESRVNNRVVGTSASWKAVLSQVGRVAPADTTALITGESGTGKEIVARLLHQNSPRAERPFVAVNCAALPEQLLESELFGHDKGAFTGAIATKIGRIEQAAGGTLFLDEIGEMSLVVQAKFLRVLQEKEFQRVGGTRVLPADVRIIAATNRDLLQSISRGTFREDLYYRLNVFEIHVAPLRERPEDILPLADSFLEELGRSMGRPSAGISRSAREWLLAHAWPGNVRELRNAIERAILLCDGGLITREHLPAAVTRHDGGREGAARGPFDPDAPLPLGGVDLEQVERRFVEKAIGQSRGNKSKAARLLGLTRAQLYSRLEKYGLLDQ
ncbi:MAG: sigma 54-interacting transcriptional regulator [Acidobacteria bacterium]|nr:sigma 54-interacting transcriptional regulator [Acidobacteriota bacterium]